MDHRGEAADKLRCSSAVCDPSRTTIAQYVEGLVLDEPLFVRLMVREAAEVLEPLARALAARIALAQHRLDARTCALKVLVECGAQ